MSIQPSPYPMYDNPLEPILTIFYILLIGFGIYLLVTIYLTYKKDHTESTPLKPNSPVTKTHLQDTNTQTDVALTIIRERYAKGEITKKQYDEMKKDLSS